MCHMYSILILVQRIIVVNREPVLLRSQVQVPICAIATEMPLISLRL